MKMDRMNATLVEMNRPRFHLLKFHESSMLWIIVRPFEISIIV